MKITLGEAKTGTCQICQKPFLMVRHDQKFCSGDCRYEAKQFYKRLKWVDRPDRDERNKQRMDRYYAKRGDVLAKQRLWREQNPEAARAKDKATYERNKEQHIARTTEYKRLHPGLQHTVYKNARTKRPWQLSLANAKNRSQKKGFAFDLTREWCERNWTGRCAITGLNFVFGTQTHYPFSPSIDRVNSGLGYIQSNCRFVLFSVNSMRGNGTDEDMYKIAEAMIAYRKS